MWLFFNNKVIDALGVLCNEFSVILGFDQHAIETAVHSLMYGDVVVFPTETVYGLGGDATNDLAVAKIYQIKNRPTFNPLIAHFFCIKQVQEYVEVTPAAYRLAQAFWPGPMTMILKRKEGCSISLLASAGLEYIGVRIPNHPVALALLESFGRPIVAPSANMSTKISPTSAKDAMSALNNQDLLIVDGGKCKVGIESTIIDLSYGKATILRPGAITREDISKFVEISDNVPTEIKSPGQMKCHYCPNSSVRLNVADLQPGEALLGFENTKDILPNPGKHICLNLSESGDLGEAAANLFSMLRELDQLGPSAIAIMPIPNEGIGIAINDRLTRAASQK
ncbi:MAG: threonylcarbamoyl-AMP synthase [Holosporales bacterium]|nr:threonylcarbamoyl-AMP synthase [Holosporales bacterium]